MKKRGCVCQKTILVVSAHTMLRLHHLRKDSSKLMKVNKSLEINDDRRKDKEEFAHKTMFKIMKQQSTPGIDLDVFDLKPLNFHYFMAVFREAVEKKIDDLHGRLIRQINYTTGEVKNLIYNYIQFPAKDGYDAAKNKLYQLSGDPHRVFIGRR